MVVRVRDEGDPFWEIYTIESVQAPKMDPITNSRFMRLDYVLSYSSALARLLVEEAFRERSFIHPQPWPFTK